MQNWKQAQQWEANWHGDCINSYWEETKQLIYAKKMGLKAQMINGKYPSYNLDNASILDIGGGATSILLKSINIGYCEIIDPLPMPDWVINRYNSINHLYFINKPAEEYINNTSIPFDEAWIYNCLQHTKNPQKVIQIAKKHSKIIRIFEWIENGISDGHIHNLTEKDLNKWLGGNGKIETLNENGCKGLSYYGIFKGDNYEKI